MKILAKIFISTTVWTAITVSSNGESLGGVAPHTSKAQDTLRFIDFEQMALSNNPTIAEAAASIRSATGRKVQAGLYPNPTVGYTGEEMSARHFGKTSEHFFFVEQKIITGGKRKYRRAVFEQERARAEADYEAQKRRVLNTVRILYYEALGGQQQVELWGQLARIAREAVDISEQLFNVGQADRPDVLESEIEAHKAELDLIAAENSLEQVWEILAIVVGNPTLPRAHLIGVLEEEIPQLDQDAILTKLLHESPELQSARATVERSRAAIRRAQAEPIPDITIRLGLGYNFERFTPGVPVGPEGNISIGIPLPLFDRNQGGKAAAQAELDRAEQELLRQELILRARLSSTFLSYRNSFRIVEQYQQEVLPKAQMAYDLYLEKFQQMAAAYPQVLIAQRTLFQLRVEYVQSLVKLWQDVVSIQGLLLVGGLNDPGESDLRGETNILEMRRGRLGM